MNLIAGNDADHQEAPVGKPLPEGWQPEQQVLDTLVGQGVESSWLESHLAHFYEECRSSGERSFAWSAKFFKSAKRAWLRARAAEPVSQKAYIQEDWSPGERARAAIHQSGVPLWWALTLAPEFKLYWMDRQEKRDNWDLIFYHRCHQTWMRLTADQRLAITNGKLPTVGKNTENSSGNKRTRDMSIEELLTDTSWGDDPIMGGASELDVGDSLNGAFSVDSVDR